MIVTRMPGDSHRGELPPLTRAQSELRERLRDHVATLAGMIGERNMHRYGPLLEAARYIQRSFEGMGLEPCEQGFTVHGRPVRTLEVRNEGRSTPAERIVVGAHYDSVLGSPGANDNATGVAGMLEIARALGAASLARSVAFVAFVNEEPPWSFTSDMGSQRYAERCAAEGERVGAMLSLETIGFYSEDPGSQHYPFPFGLFYPTVGNFIGFVGNLGSRDLVRRCVASFRTHAAFPSEGVAAPGWITGIGWSDHQSFWRVGYPAIMVTDTALFRYAQYHSAADTPGIIDYDRLARVVDGLIEVVRDLANAPS
ncbi:MAG: M20/M25/M40 family metallo-hydrolase [Gammaproteobacteria bacterium]|nr:M20/M25/M40 family metallo-hydrolase [Gammaproteobacteria bacterium]